MRILICDDDPLLIDLLAFRLAGRGYGVTTAIDGREAIELLDRETYNAVIVNDMVPVYDGYEVIRRIRETRGKYELPVIMLGHRTKGQDVVDALELGANDYVDAPFYIEELIARLTNVMATTHKCRDCNFEFSAEPQGIHALKGYP